MDSTITLVSPTPIQLDFNKDNMRNAILTAHGQPLYKLVSPDRAQMTTELRDVNTNELLFILKQRAFLPDIVCFTYHNNGKAKNVSKWLKKAEPDTVDQRSVYLLHTEFGDYEWKVDLVHRLVLYSAGDRGKPIAHMIQGPTPSLWFGPGTERFRDQILASFLIIEREMRGVEMRSMAVMTDAHTQAGIQFAVLA